MLGTGIYQSSPLQEYTGPKISTPLWQLALSKNLTSVNLAAACDTQDLEIFSENLPLDENGRLFPNMRSLIIGSGWYEKNPSFSRALQSVVEKILPCPNLQELSIFAHMNDAAPLLARASSGSPVTALSFTSPTVDRPGCSDDVAFYAAKSIGDFNSLRILAIPSMLLHQATVTYFASLPSLEVLKVTSRLVRSEWKEDEVERCNWTNMSLAQGGFAQLRDLRFDGVPTDQLVELSGLGSLPSVRTLMVRDDKASGRLLGYLEALAALGRLCEKVQHLNLSLSSLDATSLWNTTQTIWPSANVSMADFDCASVRACT